MKLPGSEQDFFSLKLRDSVARVVDKKCNPNRKLTEMSRTGNLLLLISLILRCFSKTFSFIVYFYIQYNTACTVRFSKKSLGSDVGEIKKMSEKFKKKSVLTPRNVREKWNTVIYYKPPTLTIKRLKIKKWDINLYLYICMFLRLSFLIIWMIHSKYLFSFSGVQAMW
jgi:hypothetical protein